MKISLIAMDMDGTLLDHNSLIPQQNILAIKKAQQQGVLCAINTGRYAQNALALVKKHGLSMPVIATNGTKLCDASGRTLCYHAFEQATMLRLRQFLRENGCQYYLYGTDFLAVSEKGHRHHSELAYGETILHDYDFHFYHGEEEINLIIDRPLLKIYICDNGHLPAIREALQKDPLITISSSGIFNIEITPPGFDKATGVREFAAMYNIPLSDVMCFGDQENDAPMLTSVGWGVAMGNAAEAIKEQTRLITASNDDCGIAKTITEYVLQNE